MGLSGMEKTQVERELSGQVGECSGRGGLKSSAQTGFQGPGSCGGLEQEPLGSLLALKQDAFMLFAEGPLLFRPEDQGLQFLRGAGQNNGVKSRGRGGEMRDGIL
jgi:hypothetical protein